MLAGNLFIWQEILPVARNDLFWHQYKVKICTFFKLWDLTVKSVWLFINISCDFSILRWKLLPTFPVNIPPCQSSSWAIQGLLRRFTHRVLPEKNLKFGPDLSLSHCKQSFRLPSGLLFGSPVLQSRSSAGTPGGEYSHSFKSRIKKTLITLKHLSFVLRIFHSQIVTQDREKPRLINTFFTKILWIFMETVQVPWKVMDGHPWGLTHRH